VNVEAGCKGMFNGRSDNHVQPGAEGSAVVGRAQVVGCAAAATGQVLPEVTIENVMLIAARWPTEVQGEERCCSTE